LEIEADEEKHIRRSTVKKIEININCTSFTDDTTLFSVRFFKLHKKITKNRRESGVTSQLVKIFEVKTTVCK
jgi:hypothetical protein